MSLVTQPSRTAKPVQFFNPADPFAGVKPSNWTVQSHSPSIANQRAQGPDADGDEAAYQIYGGQESGTTEYRCYDTSQNAKIDLSAFAAGSVDHSTGTHCDNITVNYTPTDYPQISVTGHRHTHTEPGIPEIDGEPSHGTPHRVAQVSVTNLPAGFGCPAALRTILGMSASDDLAIGIASFTYTCGVTHQDENGGTGGYLASENRDGVETITVQFTGVPTTDPNPGTGWTMTAKSTPTGNTAAETSSYTFEKHVETDYPSSGSGSGSGS